MICRLGTTAPFLCLVQRPLLSPRTTQFWHPCMLLLRLFARAYPPASPILLDLESQKLVVFLLFEILRAVSHVCSPDGSPFLYFFFAHYILSALVPAPIVYTNIIRCHGRLQYTDLPHDTKFPILIPKDNYLTTLIVQSMHNQVMHDGIRETFTHIRQPYWIPQGRQLVKRIISKCVTCRKVEGPPFRSVPTPGLPQSRVQQSLVFQFTGIDYAGPLYVRDQANQTSSKMYICLFTCAVVRAVHLELVEY